LKLLFDENLSPRLVQLLANEYPGSSHVDLAGLGSAHDADVWRYAKDGGYVLVSKDSDFIEMSVLLGAPPKLVWIRRGNCSTKEIATLLNAHLPDIKLLCDTTEGRFLAIE
jgi:predicted nuclease of predicted toxin-antitoxin system